MSVHTEMDVRFWYRLTTLGISGNRLRSVPSELSLCCSLRVLALSANRIEKLSCQMGSLRSLVELRLDDNPLVSLPDDLPPSLRLMGLSVCSKLAALPSCVGRLQNLCELAVGAARLEALPRSVSDLGRLQTLQLSGNTINSVSVLCARIFLNAHICGIPLSSRLCVLKCLIDFLQLSCHKTLEEWLR